MRSLLLALSLAVASGSALAAPTARYGSSNNAILWLLIWVDDGLLVDSDASLRDRFVSDLGKRFPVEDKGELSWILGVGVAGTIVALSFLVGGLLARGAFERASSTSEDSELRSRAIAAVSLAGTRQF